MSARDTRGIGRKERSGEEKEEYQHLTLWLFLFVVYGTIKFRTAEL
jgi:hypothetical protein